MKLRNIYSFLGLFLVTGALLALPHEVVVPVADCMLAPAIAVVKPGPMLPSDVVGLDSQALMGDVVEVVDGGRAWCQRLAIKHNASVEQLEGQGWRFVELAGQLGLDTQSGQWVPLRGLMRASALRPLTREEGDTFNATIADLSVSVLRAPREDAPLVSELLLGTRVHAEMVADDVNFYAVSVGALRGFVSKQSIVFKREGVLTHAGAVAARRCVIQAAKKFLGCPYIWGGCSGRSVELGTAVSGVDCSGLVYLAYRVAGIEVPRNSFDQFDWSRVIRCGGDLQPGDCVFIAKIRGDQGDSRTHHVVMVVDVERDLIIESTGLGETSAQAVAEKGLTEQACCRIIRAEEHPYIKARLKELAHGQVGCRPGELIFFGSLL